MSENKIPEESWKRIYENHVSDSVAETQQLQQRILELEKEVAEKDELIELIGECKEDLVECVTCNRLSEKCHADSFTAAGIIGGEVVERDDWECNHCAEKEELREEIAKRDELLDRAKSIMINDYDDDYVKNVDEFCNQVQKSREGK